MSESETKFPPFAALHHGNDRLCLEFINTMAWRKSATPEERLGTPAAFLAWCRDNNLLGPATVKAVAMRWQAKPDEARDLLKKAVFTREAIYRLFHAIIRGQKPSDADLGSFNEALDLVPRRRHLEVGGGGIGWALSSSMSPEIGAIAHIIWSAADLLSSERRLRIKQCEDPRGCGWLFLDESRAGTRKWCSMGDCGNRAKAQRHHLREKRKINKMRGRR
jgi:predicted RNA-binding Zn ribbon-like protein